MIDALSPIAAKQYKRIWVEMGALLRAPRNNHWVSTECDIWGDVPVGDILREVEANAQRPVPSRAKLSEVGLPHIGAGVGISPYALVDTR